MNANVALMQMPTRRNGSDSSHRSGASTSTSSATGQEIMSRMNHATQRISAFIRFLAISTNGRRPWLGMPRLDAPFDTLPFTFQDRLRQLRDDLNVFLRSAVVGFFRSQPRQRSLDRSKKALMIQFGRIDQEADLRLRKHHALDLVQQRGVLVEYATPTVPLLVPAGLDDQRCDQQPNKLRNRIPQGLDPFL